jgi:hypothetical protein
VPCASYSLEHVLASLFEFDARPDAEQRVRSGGERLSRTGMFEDTGDDADADTTDVLAHEFDLPDVPSGP